MYRDLNKEIGQLDQGEIWKNAVLLDLDGDTIPARNSCDDAALANGTITIDYKQKFCVCRRSQARYALMQSGTFFSALHRTKDD